MIGKVAGVTPFCSMWFFLLLSVVVYSSCYQNFIVNLFDVRMEIWTSVYCNKNLFISRYFYALKIYGAILPHNEKISPSSNIGSFLKDKV
jgi:hypothetical protein